MENLFGEEYTDIPKPRKVDTANLNAAIHDILVKYDVLADTLLQAQMAQERITTSGIRELK